MAMSMPITRCRPGGTGLITRPVVGPVSEVEAGRAVAEPVGGDGVDVALAHHDVQSRR